MDDLDANDSEMNSTTMHNSTVVDEQSNPWLENTGSSNNPVIVGDLKTPDPSVLDKELVASESIMPNLEEVEPRPRVSAEVLSEFDPLSDRKEIEAQKAWASTEGRRMSLTPEQNIKASDSRSSGAAPSTPVRPASPPVSTPSPLSFPSLASLAKTFSLPKSRPHSVDAGAPSVLTPNAISSFATQQEARPTLPSTAGTSPGLEIQEASIVEAENGKRNDTASPGPRKEKNKDDPPPFDFQRFLDQMKLKSAEPVAKYLRS